MAFVVDASVAAAWLLPDEEASLADVALDRLAVEEALTPHLFWYEIRNILIVCERRGRLSEVETGQYLTRLSQLPLVEASNYQSEMVLALARAHALSVYDAVYLALAVTVAVPLATLDERLVQAAARAGTPLFDRKRGD